MPDQVSGLLSPFLRRRRIAAARPQLAGRVLDYGCGVGLLAGHVAPERYLGVDVDRDALAAARARFPAHRFEHIPSDAEAAAAIAGPFDTIALLALIEHVPDAAELLSALGQLLAPGGRVLVTTPAPAFGWAHALGARIGLFSAEAHEEHGELIDRRRMRELSALGGLELESARRFLGGANQLFVLIPRGASVAGRRSAGNPDLPTV